MTEKLSIEEVLALKWRLSKGGRRWDGTVGCEIVEAETGRILQWISPVYSQLQQQSPQGTGTFIAIGQHDQASFYYPAGVLEERPLLWPDQVADMGIGAVLTLKAPAGSFVTYLYPSKSHRSGFLTENFDLLEDQEIAFQTALTGEYQLILRPPFPFQRQELRIVVR